MTNDFTRLDFEQWVADFEPVRVKNFERDDFEFDDYALETYGHELSCVRFMLAFFPDTVWTLHDGGFISDGYHLVNRLNYLITKKPVPNNHNFEITVWEDTEEEE